MRTSGLVAVVVMLLLATMSAEANQAMVLERVLPLKAPPLEQLMELDRARHVRMGVVNFPVETTDLEFFSGDGVYYTSVTLGNPPKKHTFKIDTHSDVSWVACKGCRGCPTKSTLKIQLDLYDPNLSSTSSGIPCSDSCTSEYKSGSKVCQTSNSGSGLCGYNFKYGDGTRVSGYYVSDTMYFETIMGNKPSANTSASVVFGCTNSLSGVMHTDGTLGFGQQQLSILSQLNSLGLSPKVFSHCLRGTDEGGGTFLLGEIMEPTLVFTPLVGPNYNLNLEGIAVNGQNLPIDSSIFATSNKQGTIVDPGTTLTYLVDEAYDALTSAIVAAISPSVSIIGTTPSKARDYCFVCDDSVDLLFPTVTLYFKGSAAMTVKARHYLMRQGAAIEEKGVWCIAWLSTKDGKNGHGITVLGDIVLHDKLVVYDLKKMRLGWTDYNCSLFNRNSGASSCCSGLLTTVVAGVLLAVSLIVI